MKHWMRVLDFLGGLLAFAMGVIYQGMAFSATSFPYVIGAQAAAALCAWLVWWFLFVDHGDE